MSRRAENMLNAVLVAAYSTNIFTDYGFNQQNFLIAIPVMFAGAFYFEGIRVHQLPTFLSYVFYVMISSTLLSQFNVALNLFCAILPVFSFYLSIIYGDLSFRKLRISGQYQNIGLRDTRLSSNGKTNQVSVFYPSNTPVTEANNTNWLRHGDKTLLGIARASGGNAYGNKGNKHGPLWIMRGFLNIKMDVSLNGELPEEFEEGHKKLIPLIFLHGISSNRAMNTGTSKDLASHGYIVFTMDHEDGTCSYTVSEDGSRQ